MAVCQKFKIENEIIPRIARCFGGGIGGTGYVCGAVVGATMAIGLIKERDDTEESKKELTAVTREFISRFKNEMKNIDCRELTGYDFTDNGEREKFMNSDIPQTVCFPAVNTAYKIVVDLLDRN